MRRSRDLKQRFSEHQRERGDSKASDQEKGPFKDLLTTPGASRAISGEFPGGS